MELKTAIVQFLEFVEEPPSQHRDRQLLNILDQIIASVIMVEISLESISDLDNDIDPPEHNESNWKQIRTKFPEYGFYCIPERVCGFLESQDMLQGWATDDLLDIYNTFSDYIWRSQHINEEIAIWYLLRPERLHLEDHLRNLQFYLYHKIIEDYYNEDV